MTLSGISPEQAAKVKHKILTIKGININSLSLPKKSEEQQGKSKVLNRVR